MLASMKKAGWIVFTILMLIFSSSCSNRFYDAMKLTLSKYDENDGKDIHVSFSETFGFPWSELFIVDSMLYPEEVSEAIGVKYDGEIVPEGKRLFVFMLNGSIVKARHEQCLGITFVGMKRNGVVNIKNGKNYRLGRKMLNGKPQYLLFMEEEGAARGEGSEYQR